MDSFTGNSYAHPNQRDETSNTSHIADVNGSPMQIAPFANAPVSSDLQHPNPVNGQSEAHTAQSDSQADIREMVVVNLDWPHSVEESSTLTREDELNFAALEEVLDERLYIEDQGDPRFTPYTPKNIAIEEEERPTPNNPLLGQGSSRDLCLQTSSRSDGNIESNVTDEVEKEVLRDIQTFLNDLNQCHPDAHDDQMPANEVSEETGGRITCVQGNPDDNDSRCGGPVAETAAEFENMEDQQLVEEEDDSSREERATQEDENIEILDICGFIIRFRYESEMANKKTNKTKNMKCDEKAGHITIKSSVEAEVYLSLTMEDENRHPHPNSFYKKSNGYNETTPKELKKVLHLSPGTQEIKIPEFGIKRTPKSSCSKESARTNKVNLVATLSRKGRQVSQRRCEVSCQKALQEKKYKIIPDFCRWNAMSEIKIFGNCADLKTIHFTKPHEFNESMEPGRMGDNKNSLFVIAPKFNNPDGGKVDISGETGRGALVHIGQFEYKPDPKGSHVKSQLKKTLEKKMSLGKVPAKRQKLT